MLKQVLLLVILVPRLAVAQSADGLGRGEVFGSVMGVKFKGAPKWYGGAAVGLALDLFHRPQTPVLAEYVAGAETAAGNRLPFGHAYLGGGVQGVFVSVTGGGGSVEDGLPTAINGLVPHRTTSGPAASIAAGTNVGVRPKWGVRGEVRLTGIHASVQQWIFQVGGGLFYRFKK